jgi:glycosyltransferase involved in cell wall biosynthesis
MRFYAHAARLQTVSRPIKEAIVSEVPDRKKSVECIPNPLPERRLQTGGSQARHREKQILYVGRVHPEKGLHLLVSALALIPDEIFTGWKLVVVGPADPSGGGGGDEYLATLKQKAKAIPERIEWRGPVFDPAALAEHYQRASLFVYPSLAERGETFGLAPLEAMSYGCPALVSSLACFGDFITHEVNGFIFDHRAPEPATVLAGAIGRLLSDPARIDQARSAAVRKTEDYALERIAGMYLQDFESLSSRELAARS